MFTPIPPLMPNATPEQEQRYQELLAQRDWEMTLQLWLTVGSFVLMLVGIAAFAVWQAWFA